MAIQIQCPGCNALLQIDDSLAGKQGKCIHCGHRIVVPGPLGAPSADAKQPLTELSPEAMVRELHFRNKSALLLMFEPSAEGSYHLADVPDAAIKCIVTEDINQERFAQLVGSISERFSRKRKRPAGTAAQADDVPFDLKGDRLGMRLEDFKERYARYTPGGQQDLPICSDQSYGGKAELHSQAWHRNAKIVHARVDRPEDDNSPTVAGVKSDLLLFQFVDGKLFRITGFLPTDLFHVVNEALAQKYGPPTKEIKQPREVVWENKVSLVVITRGSVHPRVPSTLHLVHKELAAVAESRAPTGMSDV
jgi:hypothetical protein